MNGHDNCERQAQLNAFAEECRALIFDNESRYGRSVSKGKSIKTAVGNAVVHAAVHSGLGMELSAGFEIWIPIDSLGADAFHAEKELKNLINCVVHSLSAENERLELFLGIRRSITGQFIWERKPEIRFLIEIPLETIPDDTETVAALIDKVIATPQRVADFCEVFLTGGDLSEQAPVLYRVYRDIYLPSLNSLVPVTSKEKDGMLTLTSVAGTGDRFVIPDGVERISCDAFKGLIGQLHYLYIPASVQKIDRNTFSGFSNPSIKNSDDWLVIECEVKCRPEGFFVDLWKDYIDSYYLGFDGDYVVSLMLHSWLGTCCLGSKPDYLERLLDNLDPDNCSLNEFAEVRWDCDHPSMPT